MKKVLICLLALMWLSGCALAESFHVYDPSGVLNDQETAALESRAQRLWEEYGVDLLLGVTTDPIGMEAEDYAPRLYADRRGEEAQENYGVVLIDLCDRTYGFRTEGALGRAMNRYGARNVENLLLRYLADGEYYGAMDAWLGLVSDLCQPDSKYGDAQAKPLTPLEFAGQYIVFVFIGALVISGIVVGIMISKMKTARFQSAANAYVVENSMELRTATEHFLYETVTRRKIERNTHTNGGGSHSGSNTCSGGGHF